MKSPKSLESKINDALRKIWMQSKERRQVESSVLLSPKKKGNYYCPQCKKIKNKKETPLNIDHIDPVGPCRFPDGRIDWNLKIERMFIRPDLLRPLCKPCHDLKTYNK